MDRIKLNRFKFGENRRLVNLVTTLTDIPYIANIYAGPNNLGSDLIINLEREPVYTILNAPYKDYTIPIYECKLSRNINSDTYKYPFALISQDVNCEGNGNELVRLAGYIYNEKYKINTLDLFRCSRTYNNDHWVADSDLSSKECGPSQSARREGKLGNALQNTIFINGN